MNRKIWLASIIGGAVLLGWLFASGTADQPLRGWASCPRLHP